MTLEITNTERFLRKQIANLIFSEVSCNLSQMKYNLTFRNKLFIFPFGVPHSRWYSIIVFHIALKHDKIQ